MPFMQPSGVPAPQSMDRLHAGRRLAAVGYATKGIRAAAAALSELSAELDGSGSSASSSGSDQTGELLREHSTAGSHLSEQATDVLALVEDNLEWPQVLLGCTKNHCRFSCGCTLCAG